MRLDVSLQQKQVLEQRLSPQQIQAIELLQLPTLDMKDRIEEELQENEALEVDDAAEADAAPGATADADDAAGADDDGEPGVDEEVAATIDRVLRDAEEERALAPASSRAERELASDRRLEALQAAPAPPPTLHEILAEQLALLDAEPGILDLARDVVYSLDEDGRLAVHPMARAVLEAMDEEGVLRAPLEEVVAIAPSPAAPAAAPGDDEGPRVDGATPYGSYGFSSRGPGPAGRRRGPVRDPERAAAQREARAKEREGAREEALREAGRVAAACTSLRRRLAAEGRAGLPLAETVLLFPLSEILDAREAEGRPGTLAEAERALALVQSLEPRGVGGRSVEETLLLQIRPGDPRRDLKRRLILEHLADWTRNRLPRICQGLGIGMEELEELLEDMRELDRRPGARLRSEPTTYLNPDVVVEWSEDGYVVRIVNEYFPSLRISADWVRLAEDPNAAPEERELAKRKVLRARWFVDAVRQRQETLLKVVTAVVAHQREFLDLGVTAMRPLKMQRIADEVGIHVSTVSRAIAGKYAQTPQGILALKSFFHGGTDAAHGAVESRLSVKERVRRAIADEDRRNPLSDEELATRLQAEGLEIKRRTVTKYRKQLKIPSSRERRAWS